MGTSRTGILCTGAGFVFGLGWWSFIDDGASWGGNIKFFYVLPGIFTTFAAFILVGLDFEALRGGVFGGEDVTRARFWFLVALTIFTGSLVLAVWILTDRYTGEKNAEINAWPGVSIVLQVFFVFVSGCIFAVGRAMGGPGF